MGMMCQSIFRLSLLATSGSISSSLAPETTIAASSTAAESITNIWSSCDFEVDPFLEVVVDIRIAARGNWLGLSESERSLSEHLIIRSAQAERK